MKLADFKKTFTTPLRQTTLSVFIKDDNVLLAFKKRGFGSNLWNCPGGKPDPGETLEQTANRETTEEIGCTPLSLTKVAIFDFYFPLLPKEKDFNQQVVVFKINKWKGEPVETEEMRPEWFAFDKIPYDQMWPDDILWLPKILAGKLLRAKFAFGENNEIMEYNLQEVSSF